MSNSADNNDVVILAAARTPQGRLNGQLASFTAVELGAHAIRAALAASGVKADQVDAVIMGQVLQAGAGQNPARQSAIGAGIGWNVPTVTINKVCLSGLTAVIDAARMIRSGDATVVVAGGQESMTRAPHVLPGSRQGWTYGTVQALDVAAHDGLTDAFDGQSMGLSTESKNLTLGIDRASQDEVAAPVAPARRPGRQGRRLRRRDRPDQRQAAQGRSDRRRPPTRASGRTRPSNRWPACARRSSRTEPSPPATPLPCPTAPPPWC